MLQNEREFARQTREKLQVGGGGASNMSMGSARGGAVTSMGSHTV